MAQQTAADDAQELADRHAGAEVAHEQISGTFEYEVVLSSEKIDELPENMTALEFAENIAVSRANKEIDPTFSIRGGSNAMSKEDTDWTMNGERRFTVWVRFDKND